MLVFVPRDRYTTDLRRRIGELLEAGSTARSSWHCRLHSEGPLTRIHYIAGRYRGHTPVVARADHERNCSLVRTWRDDFAAESGSSTTGRDPRRAGAGRTPSARHRERCVGGGGGRRHGGDGGLSPEVAPLAVSSSAATATSRTHRRETLPSGRADRSVAPGATLARRWGSG